MPANVDIILRPVWQDVWVVRVPTYIVWFFYFRSDRTIHLIIRLALLSSNRVCSKAGVVVKINIIQLIIFVDCHVTIIITLLDKASHCGFNGGIIEKSSGHFLTALFVDPLSSPANGQFLISTRQRRACRRLLPPPACYPRQCASNSLNIVDFGPFIIVFDGYVGKYYLDTAGLGLPRPP
jgi:hypothetical protein